MFRRPMDSILSALLYLCFSISLYLIYDWALTERQIQCIDSPANYGLYTFENFSGVLLKDMEDASKPADTHEIEEFKSRLSKVDWGHVDGELKKFETVMGRLLDQLESAKGKFAGPIHLRQIMIKEIEDYDLCRNKIRGDNRDLSHRYETLELQQKEYEQQMRSLEKRKSDANQQMQKLLENRTIERRALTDKEYQLTRAQEELEVMEEKGKVQLDRLYEDMQAQKKRQIDEIKAQIIESENAIIRIRSSRQLLKEESIRLKGKIEGLLANRDLVASKLEKLELKIDYEAGLAKLLPHKDSISKTQQMEKIEMERVKLYLKMLSKAKGLPEEKGLKAEVEQRREKLKSLKKLLGSWAHMEFKYNANFERSIESTKNELRSLNSDLNETIHARDAGNAKIHELTAELEQKQANYAILSQKLHSKESAHTPKDMRALEINFEQQKSSLSKKVEKLQAEIDDIQNTLKDMEYGLGEGQSNDNDLADNFHEQSSEINRKMKENEAELIKFKRILSGKLAECNNKKKFIESIQQQGAEQLDDAVRYYRDIKAAKQEAKNTLNNLYIR